MTPAGSLVRSCADLGRDAVGDRDGVARGLAGDVEQHRRLAVRGDEGVDGHGGAWIDLRDVADAHGRAVGSGLDGELAEAVEVVRLRADEREDELMVLLVEAG